MYELFDFTFSPFIKTSATANMTMAIVRLPLSDSYAFVYCNQVILSDDTKKSTDRELFGGSFVRKFCGRKMSRLKTNADVLTVVYTVPRYGFEVFLGSIENRKNHAVNAASALRPVASTWLILQRGSSAVPRSRQGPEF